MIYVLHVLQEISRLQCVDLVYMHTELDTKFRKIDCVHTELDKKIDRVLADFNKFSLDSM